MSAPAAAQTSPLGHGGTIRCESNSNRQQVCRTGWRDAILVRQLSDTRCTEGRNWGSANGTIWVNGGCRGEFGPGRGGGWGGGNGNSNTIRCESNSNRQQTCRTGWRRNAVLVRQLSDTRCIEGRNWGSGNGMIWVNGGCRGEFAEGRNGGNWGGGGPGGNWGGGNNGTVRCESNSNRQQTCNTGWRRSAVLVRQLSDTRCIEGRNWRSGNGTIWVSGGCRGEFAEARNGSGWGGGGSSNYVVDCASDGNRVRSCGWDRRQGRPVIIQQLSNTQCVEGRNWGYNGNSIWVNGGCRARFGTR
ncbi:MAG: DUF3011 domain-containing protein [Stenotrophomonas sp.]|uniref:DUF3011 domain-containing protein n=1 Tax=Stenotrophomonas sp. TaxID=69392 RepID=UPI003D6D476F